MSRDVSHEGDDQGKWIALGVALCVAIGIADIVTANSVVLIPLLVIAPLVTALWGSPKTTMIVAITAAVVAIPLGWFDDAAGSPVHLIGIITTVTGGVVAVFLFALERCEPEMWSGRNRRSNGSTG